MNDIQHSRMPSPTPQRAQSPIIATHTLAPPAETSPHSTRQHSSPSSQPAPNGRTPRDSSLRNSSPTHPPPKSRASMTTSPLSHSDSMATTQIQPNNLAIRNNNSQHQPPEPQHQQPDPVDSSDSLEEYSWDDLEERFHAKMADFDRAETIIERDFKELLNVCFIPLYPKEQKLHSFSSTSHSHDANHPNNRSSSDSGRKPVPNMRKSGRVNGAYPSLLLNQVATRQPIQGIRSQLDPYSLRTQIAFVQRSEKTLEDKQKHCAPLFNLSLSLLSPYVECLYQY